MMLESPDARSRRRRLVTLAAALAGALAAAGTAQALPSTAGPQAVSSAPSGSPAGATPPVGRRSATAGIGTVRPVPPAVTRTILGAFAARGARRGQARLSGVRPIPGTTLSTDLPTRIEVGTSITVVRFTISTPNDFRKPIGVVTLLDDDHLLTQVGIDGTAPGQATYRGALAMDERTLTTRGIATWVLGVFDEADQTGEAGQIAFLQTTVKLRSLLAQSVTRRGDVVDLVGAAKVYTHDEAYAAYPSHTIYLQRWTKTGWATIRTLRTDHLGHVTTQLRVPFTAGLRLWSPDAPTAFGAVTARAVV